jgi:hypothetical protein
VPQTLSRSNEGLMELIQIGTADIAQLHALEVIPNALIRVEIRSVARQLFQLQAFGCPSLEKGCDLVAAMDGRAVPDDHDLA